MNRAKSSKEQASERPSGAGLIKVPPEYWEGLVQMDPITLCDLSLATLHNPEGLRIRFLNDEVVLDFENRCLWRLNNGGQEKIVHPLLELVILVYLLNVGPDLLSRELISTKDLKDAHFFQGPHALKVKPLLQRFGNDLAGFKRAAESLGGEPMDMADAAYRFSALPKVPLYYLLWEGDDEFQPNLNILFDRSIERHLSADAIWGLVNLVSKKLLKAD